ncbi:hypothetical protein GOBAR_AA40083 [Gossypium barbadense]|uniref:Uncharacterized protein n=1 Tax=Gossypium barbadense TaxID=3634 RepID=A0A2P5VP78_GOSBA|nr:hypothetical protein GOBAR_AA40083 [Gossypium barbadense]
MVGGGRKPATKLLVKISTLPTHDGERRSIKARTGKKTSELELAETGLQLELVKQLDLDTTLLCSFDENNVKSLKLYEEKLPYPPAYDWEILK